MTATRNPEWIPNIDLGVDYDRRYRDARLHYDELHNLADHFGRKMPVHRHAQSCQLHCIENGRVNFHIEDQVYDVDGPCVFFTPSAVPHSFETEPRATGHVLTLHQTLLWQIVQRARESDIDRALAVPLCLSTQSIRPDQIASWEYLWALVRRLGEEWRECELARNLVLESQLSMLLVLLTRLSDVAEVSRGTHNEELGVYNRFIREVEQHYREHWVIAQYLAVLGVSERRLTRVCHHISHTTPKQLILERVLNEARRLLAFTDKTANEIAYEVGFADPAYFSRVFRRSMGMTPLQYRQQSNTPI